MQMELTKWEDNFILKNRNIALFGLVWDSKNDNLFISVERSRVKIYTKRDLTAFICSFWDPLGFFSPYIIELKCILSDLWKRKQDWDSHISTDILQQINNATSTFNQLNKVPIPRYVRVHNLFSRLLLFCDASSKAYGAVIYFSNMNEKNECVRQNLLISKCRVVPNKSLTIPKIELSSALLGAKLLKYCLSELDPVDDYLAFSDSHVTLYWIKNKSKKWKAICSKSSYKNSPINISREVELRTFRVKSC